MDDDRQSEFESRYVEVLGKVLRRRRKELGWSIKAASELLAELPDGQAVAMSPATLNSYELATRSVRVGRLATLCVALKSDVMDVLAEVTRTMRTEQVSGLSIDLAKLAEYAPESIAPAANWARVELASHKGPTCRQVPWAAVRILAELCGMDALELVVVLEEIEKGGTGECHS